MHTIPLALVVGLAAVLTQACGSGDDPPRGSPFASCAPIPTYTEDGRFGRTSAEGSSATYRFERADGSTEDVTATVSSIERDTITYVLEGDAGAYSVTDEIDCTIDHDAPGAPPYPASDIANDRTARALLGGGPRFDEPYPPAPDPDEEQALAPEPEPDVSDRCRRLDGSDEVEQFAERPISRCTLTARPDPDGEEIMLTVETTLGAFGPVAGLIFKKRVRASGEVDRVRLIDWNGL